MKRITLEACAKVNLSLKIIGRRPDGFHDIETVVQSVSLSDTLFIESAPERFNLEVDDPSIPSDRSNLAWRAASLLKRASGRSGLGANIRIRKRIPAAAGLGGGSSDAACTLVALNQLWDLALNPRDLEALAAEIGSDVPYFLSGGTALLLGRGVEVRPLPDLLGYRLLIVHPGSPLTSGEVYREVRAPLTPMTKTDTMPCFGPIAGAPVEAWVERGNDLTPHARRLCPIIGELTERLLASGATAAAMTGSGSAVFGVYRENAVLQAAERSLARPEWHVMACEPVGRSQFRRDPGLKGAGDRPPRRDVGHGDH